MISLLLSVAFLDGGGGGAFDGRTVGLFSHGVGLVGAGGMFSPVTECFLGVGVPMGTPPFPGGSPTVFPERVGTAPIGGGGPIGTPPFTGGAPTAFPDRVGTAATPGGNPGGGRL